MPSREAFDIFREQYGPARLPVKERIRNEDEVKQMTSEDGLIVLDDGPVDTARDAEPPSSTPTITEADLNSKQLWTVREDDVVYAEELCPFGKTLETRVIKHTNLTGGRPAYAGGELLWRDRQTLIVNGQSGRYGIRSSDEMTAISVAFRKSGYHVWSMGYDIEADLPFPFVGVAPQWIP
jgi:hypothetical protein